MFKTFELFLEKPKALNLREVKSLPTAKDNEVKVDVIYGGICGSDLRVFNGSISYARYPIRPGHEILGKIVEVGAEVTYKIGTKVVIFPNTFCGTCEFCLRGQTNICPEKKPIGVSIDGGFAQQLVVESKYVVPVPDNLDNKRAILTEPLAVTVHALNKAKLSRKTSVAIVGCGTEGLLAVALALQDGAKVTAIDINPVKLDLARKLGNVETREPYEVRNEVFDVVIEAAGVKTAIEQAINIVKPGGVLIALGILGEAVELYPVHIVRNEISILGTIVYTLEDFSTAIAYLSNPQFNVEPVVSEILSFKQYAEAYQKALSGNYAKIVLDFSRI